MTRNHVERDKIFPGADEVFVVGIENTQVVLGSVVGAIGDFLETQGGEPAIDFRHANRDDLEAGLGGDDGEFAVCLMDNTLHAVEAGNEEILEVKAFQILDGRGFPEVEAAGILRGGNERKLDAGAEAEDAIAGDFEDAFALFQDFMFLTAAIQKGDDFLRIQQETQIVCPFTETGFLPGKRERPR